MCFVSWQPDRLTSAILFSPGLWNRNLSVYNRFGLQDVFVMAIPRRCLLLGRPTWSRAVATLGCVNFWKNCCFVKKSQVSFKVKVCIQTLIHAISKTLIISVLHLPILHTVLFWCCLICPSATRRPCLEKTHILTQHDNNFDLFIQISFIPYWGVFCYTYRSCVFVGILLADRVHPDGVLHNFWSSAEEN